MVYTWHLRSLEAISSLQGGLPPTGQELLIWRCIIFRAATGSVHLKQKYSVESVEMNCPEPCDLSHHGPPSREQAFNNSTLGPLGMVMLPPSLCNASIID